MQIIPVLDLSNGHVVHAVEGNRQNYRTIESRICSSAEPFSVIEAYLNLHEFKSIYIADLDALENRGEHFELVHSICKKYPTVSFWLDCGINLISRYIDLHVDNLRLILSSESIPSSCTYISILEKYPRCDFIISLDFKDDKLLGFNELLSKNRQRLDEIIVLNLNCVGSNSGFLFPNFVYKNRINENFKLYVGGGIRNIDDLIELRKQDIKGVLIASSLHSKAITSEDLKLFSQSL